MSESNKQLILSPIKQIQGNVTVPGSKSLSNRALLLAALCNGTTRITNLLDSDDIQHMLKALTQLGVEVNFDVANGVCTVIGNGGRFTKPESPLFLGNAGTAMRPLAAILSVLGIDSVLTGEPRMFERPIGHLIDALKPIGVDIEYQNNVGFPPVKIAPLKHIEESSELKLEIDGSISSQFLTAILMAIPLLKRQVVVKVKGELVSKPYIALTLSILESFGVSITNDNFSTFTIDGKQTYRSPGTYMVEGDASSASYFLAAGAISGGPVSVYGVGKKSVQGDIKFAEVLKKMGAVVEYFDDHIKVSSNGQLKGINADLNHIPDAAMTIATTALFASGTTSITNIYNWRVKETDRLHAMATELRKVGAIVEEGHDYITITPQVVNFAEIDTYDDHRIAMCFSLLALSSVGVAINDPQVTSKTFPDYFDRFNSLTS